MTLLERATGEFRIVFRSAAAEIYLVRSIAKVLSLLPLWLGVGFLTWGIARYRLPYENGRYFDPRIEVVYHAQTAETFVVIGTILTLAGLVIAIGAFRCNRHRHVQIEQHR
jgi:uncharacterized membrane protein HdeD (DUF308 family)